MTQRDAALLPRLQALQADQPCWGDRRIWAYPRFVEPLSVHERRILRLMREHPLLVTRHLRLQAKRAPAGSKPRPPRPNKWGGIEITKALGAGFGWISIAVGLDWYAQKSVGDHAGVRCTATHWLGALDMAVNQPFPEGARGQGLSLMSDNGCQPTAAAFAEASRALGIHQTLTSDDHPKGNADTERFRRTRKEECRWLQDWTRPFALLPALARRVADDNEPYRHATPGYKPPRQVDQAYHARHNPPLAAA